MKKMILLSLLVLYFPFIGYGQDKVEAPVWNVGDKWMLSEEVIVTVLNADQDSYTVKYLTPRWELTVIFDKSSLNRLYYMDGEKRIKYEIRNKRLFNFPLHIGKTWKDQYVTKSAASASQEGTYIETFTVLGWEEAAVQAGKFKALKLEYKQETVGQSGSRPKEGKVWYWYSPDVKYFVKCQYDKTDYWDATNNWELVSSQLKR
jgi:hypothetical protein